MVLGQTLGLLRQRRHQRQLLMRFDFEFDQLGEAAIFLWRLHEYSPLHVQSESCDPKACRVKPPVKSRLRGIF